jgi:hypothetical protein
LGCRRSIPNPLGTAIRLASGRKLGISTRKGRLPANGRRAAKRRCGVAVAALPPKRPSARLNRGQMMRSGSISASCCCGAEKMKQIPAILFLLGAAPAMAFDTSQLGQGGSLFLSDIASVIGTSPSLRREVDQQLSHSKKKQTRSCATAIGFLVSGLI